MRKSGKLNVFIVPLISLGIILLAYFFLEPTTTGLVILDSGNAIQQVEAEVTVSTKSGEVIPPDTVVEVEIDGKKAAMRLSEFIQKTKEPYELESGELAFVGFSGKGFTGNHIYKLPLSAFSLERSIGKGEHVFKTRLVYQRTVLYEKENKIMIGGVEDARTNASKLE